MKTSISEKAKIGVMICGHKEYWPQFKGLKERLMDQAMQFVNWVKATGVDVVGAPFVDTVEDSTPLIDINKRSDDDNKANTLAIVFSAIGGVVILGGILGLTIYFKKKATTNLINSNKEPGSSVSNIKF